MPFARWLVISICPHVCVRTHSPPPPFDRPLVTLRVHQIQQHLGIEEDDGDGKAESIQDEVYEVDTNMTPEQVRLCLFSSAYNTTL